MSFKDKLVESWKMKHLSEEDHGTHPGNKEDEKEDVKLIKKVVKSDCLKKEDIGGLTESEVDQVILEVLSKDAKAGDWIHDFVHSKNPKFVGKSKAKRRQMALAAYYGKQQEELDPTVRTKDTEKGREPTKQKDDVGPASDGKSTKVKFTPGPKNEETVAEAIGIKKVVKNVGSKLVKSLTGGSDEDQLKRLQKNMGIPQTGKPGHAKQNEEVESVEEGWDDMLKDVKAKKGPQPSGGSGVKQGSRYGGGKQTSKPEHDEDEPKKKVSEGKDPSMDAGCGSAPDFAPEVNKPLALAKDAAKKASLRVKKDLSGEK